MDDLVITSSGGDFEATIKRLSPEIRKRGMTLMHRLVYLFRDRARQKYDEAGLHVRSGALKASIEAVPPVETDHDITAKVFAGQKLKYARVQEYGATIRPKNAQFLAIPLDAAKTPAGVARFSPRQAISAGYESTFVRGGVIFGKRGGTIEPLFALKRSVTIPARPFMRPAAESMKPEIESGIRSALAAAASAAKG